MKLEGDYWFEATVPEVWSALFDPVILAAVMPGCEKLELVDGQYVGEIKVKVGPIQGKFTGKVDLKDKDEPHSYTMVVDGRGAPGFVKATAGVKLTADGAGTRVFYDTDAQIGGKIASVGQRLIEASARAIVAQSLEGLHTNIKLRAAAYREAMASHAVAAPPAVAAPTASEIPAVSSSPAPDGGAALATPAPGAEPAGAGATPPVPVSATSSVPVPATSSAPVSATSAATPAAPVSATSAATPAAPVSATPSAPVSATSSAPVLATSSAPVLATSSAPSTPASAPAAIVAAATPAVVATPALAVTSPTPPTAKATPVIAFTPVKTKQSALANAVAKEVASSLFPRSVLVAIILIEALVIVWLLVRH